MYKLTKGNLCVELCAPGEYYQGTRFDHSGVFRSISKGDYCYADEWFPVYHPQAHDAVCGPSEEFVTVDLEHTPVGENFVKVGVGLLKRPDDEPYDWFRLYDIAEPGRWTVHCGTHRITYIHELEGFYVYTKVIELTSEDSFTIAHTLEWKHPTALKGHTYNHNFFTFNGAGVGPLRRVDFPFMPAGQWRMEYHNVALQGKGIRFQAPITQTPSVYMGNLHNANGSPTPYHMLVSEADRSVEIEGSEGVTHCVFWANPQVACIEPYMPLHLRQGECKQWTINYKLT